jgi:hypothetical protein
MRLETAAARSEAGRASEKEPKLFTQKRCPFSLPGAMTPMKRPEVVAKDQGRSAAPAGHLQTL